MRMNKVKWVEKLDKDTELVSAVRVEVLRQDRFGNYDSGYFSFHIGYKNRVEMLESDVLESYCLKFIDENSYKVFIENSYSEIFIYPMLFRNTINMTEFLANEAEDSESYHTITGMIMNKLYEVLLEKNESMQ